MLKRKQDDSSTEIVILKSPLEMLLPEEMMAGVSIVVSVKGKKDGSEMKSNLNLVMPSLTPKGVTYAWIIYNLNASSVTVQKEQTLITCHGLSEFFFEGRKDVPNTKRKNDNTDSRGF